MKRGAVVAGLFYPKTREELEGQIYAFNESEGTRKLRKAVNMGIKQNLCTVVNSDTWELNLTFKNPEPYLRKINELLQQQSLETFL